MFREPMRLVLTSNCGERFELLDATTGEMINDINLAKAGLKF